MGTYRHLLIFLSFFAVASAQQPVNDPVKLEGIVINSVTGHPLPRAVVQLNSDRALLTGAEGEFSFDNVQAGPVHLSVDKPGFFGPGAAMRGMPGVIDTTLGPDTGPMVIKLAPEAVIFGHVIGKDEEPLEGVQIQILSEHSPYGLSQRVPAHGSAQTDEDGEYRIAGLPAGHYVVWVKAVNAARRILGARNARMEESYPPIVYYPNTADFSSATEINLVPGQRVEASFSLTPVAAYRIAGSVAVAGEWKQVNPPMMVDSRGQILFSADKADPATHTFEFRAVPAGTYIVRTMGRDLQDRSIFSEQTITVAHAMTALKLTLRPGVDIPVVVRDQLSRPRQGGTCYFNQPSGGVHTSDCSDFPAARVELIGIESSRQHYSTDWAPQVQAAGYGIHGVMPGKYMVRARPNLSGYVQSVRCGGQDLLREPLVVPDTGSVGAIEVTVRDDGATLKVQVQADKPLEHALVLLLPEGELSAEPRIMGRGTPGTVFQYGSVAPGRYKIFAFDSAEEIDYQNPETLAKYATSAASVTVSANDNANIAVNVIHTEN